MSTDSQRTDKATYLIGDMVTTGLEIAGTLNRVVINPLTKTLTHLVVVPLDADETARLVPVSLVDPDRPGIALRCDQAGFAALPAAQESHFLSDAQGQLGYRSDQVSAWPYYGLGVGGMGLGMGGMGYGAGSPAVTTTDRVPVGEIEVRRGDQVQATDGDIGKVQGLVIDRTDEQVTHVLLEEGHLWKHKQVAIPISAITSSSDGVSLRLSKKEVGELPAVDVDLPSGQ